MINCNNAQILSPKNVRELIWHGERRHIFLDKIVEWHNAISFSSCYPVQHYQRGSFLQNNLKLRIFKNQGF